MFPAKGVAPQTQHTKESGEFAVSLSPPPPTFVRFEGNLHCGGIPNPLHKKLIDILLFIDIAIDIFVHKFPKWATGNVRAKLLSPI